MVVSHDSHVSYDHVRVAGSDAGGISAEARSLSSSAMPDSYAAPFAAFSGAVPTLPLTGRLSTIICQQCPEFRVWSIPAGGVKGFRHPLRESSPPLRGQYIIGKDDDDCISHRPQSLPLAFIPSVLSFVAAMRVSIVFDDDPLFGVCDIDCRLVSQLRNEYLPVFDRLRQSVATSRECSGIPWWSQSRHRGKREHQCISFCPGTRLLHQGTARYWRPSWSLMTRAVWHPPERLPRSA